MNDTVDATSVFGVPCLNKSNLYSVSVEEGFINAAVQLTVRGAGGLHVQQLEVKWKGDGQTGWERGLCEVIVRLL